VFQHILPDGARQAVLCQSFHFAIQLKQEGRTLRRLSPCSGREEAFGREMD